jgi:hypothetical protein
MLSGFIDPNSPLFAPYSTDLPNFYDRSSSTVTGPDGTTNDMGAPVFTSGSVTATGNIATAGILLENTPIVALGTTGSAATLVATLTGNSCLNSLITLTASGALALNLPATTALIAVLGSSIGTSFEFTVVNAGGFNATVTAADGNTTFSGSAVVNNTTGRFIVRLTTATTVIVHRA